MEKLDFKIKFKELYSPRKNSPQIVCVPKFQYAMVDGQGSPENSVEFQSAAEALYSVSYTLKFSRKKKGELPDYSVAPLEGLWWTKSGKEFDSKAPNDWLWTLMIMQPEFITSEEFNSAVEQARLKKDNSMIDSVRLESFDEGQVVQSMHVGPYDAELPTLEKMFKFAAEEGYMLCGKHHEIYFGDPRRVSPQKLKTILRHPISRVEGD